MLLLQGSGCRTRRAELQPLLVVLAQVKAIVA